MRRLLAGVGIGAVAAASPGGDFCSTNASQGAAGQAPTAVDAAAPAQAGQDAVLKLPPLDARMHGAALAAAGRGLEFLAASQQPDGGWILQDKSHPAVTALIVKCFLQDPRYGPEHPVSRRGLDFILRSVRSDGGIYVDGEGLNNYHTSVALMALAAANDPKYEPTIRRAQAYLRDLQWDDAEGYGQDHAWYGGQGYGGHKRPDLSNTQMMVEALHDSGLAADDPAYGKAVAFISRCQMLSETNDRPFARGGGDGGFVYTSAGDGESKAGTEVFDGVVRLRSYGSMTYAGFKSLLYAGIGRKDVRVQRAYEWIRRHYTLDSNPNMPGESSHMGLYYYYHVFARALQAWGEPIIVDAHGNPHRWREELIAKLTDVQQKDGSWVNDADRWYEGNPYLVTAYAVLAIQAAVRGT